VGAAGDLRSWRLAGHCARLAGRRLVLIDPRGHGLSGRPRDPSAHRIGEYVEDVLAVLEAESIERCAFWGHGDGGAVGLELCVAGPGRVAAVVASGAIEHPAARPRLARAVRAVGMAGLVRLIQHDEGELPAWLWLQYLDTDPEMFCLELEAWAEWPGPWRLAPAIEVPVLLCVGEAEDPDHDADGLAAEMPAGGCLRLEGLGHLGAFLSPVAGEAVGAFLDAL
ncbi:MAG TPA: alpha/beta fold hydrolase, partial [Gaiellales bacterium]|nr:alpha/beta fold hydrolase [Gaiellales bacterium]